MPDTVTRFLHVLSGLVPILQVRKLRHREVTFGDSLVPEDLLKELGLSSLEKRGFMGLLSSDFCQSPREQMYLDVAPEGRAGTQEWKQTWTQYKEKKSVLGIRVVRG